MGNTGKKINFKINYHIMRKHTTTEQSKKVIQYCLQYAHIIYKYLFGNREFFKKIKNYR